MSSHLIVTIMLCVLSCEPTEIRVWDGDSLRLGKLGFARVGLIEHLLSLEPAGLVGEYRVLKSLLGRRTVPFGDHTIDLGKERGAHADILAGIEEVGVELGDVLNAETGRILRHSYPDDRLTQIPPDELHRLVLG